MIPAAIKEGFEQFRIPIAHDAHEFLVFILDQFHEALAEEVSMTIHNTVDDADVKGALEAWKVNFEKKYSPFVELLFGLQRKAVACENCKHESVSWETMNMLKVCVPKSAEPLKLIDLLEEEAKGETIEYRCEKCSGKEAKLSRRIWRLGNWVIIVLKRNENSGRRINTPVEIPLQTNFGSVFHESSKEASGRVTYELFSTIHHHGSSGGGHYTAQAQSPLNQKWYGYDDDSTHILQQPSIGSSSYILFYRIV
jgi:ubiquitin C-terminal hydrolase